MKFIKKIARALGVKKIYSGLQYSMLKWRGFQLLTKEETVVFMSPYTLAVIPENHALLPRIADCADSKKIIFPGNKVSTDQLYVWDYQDAKRKGQLSRYGSVIIRGKVLCTDRTHSSFYQDAWKQDNRPVKEVPLVIAPFSHFQSEYGYSGYFDFVYFVAVKICRVKDALPDVDFSNIPIAYVPIGTSYEKEYLELLDIKPENLINTTAYKVISPRILTGNGRTWNPNIADILSLKKHIEKKFKPVKTESNKVYISRSGRRRIINEVELIVLLKKFGFQIIEDKQRTIPEQISIYHNASFIIGPHGASFGNIIWCVPGTQLFELFSPNYAPDFFLYLTTVMDMKYTAYYEGVPDPAVNYLDGIVEDIYVSIPTLEKCLKATFGPLA